jgi:hypothetical protein
MSLGERYKVGKIRTVCVYSIAPPFNIDAAVWILHHDAISTRTYRPHDRRNTHLQRDEYNNDSQSRACEYIIMNNQLIRQAQKKKDLPLSNAALVT